MSTLPEQFSAARKSQVETQVNFFQSYAARALDSAQKILALNLSLSRASMEKSSAAMVDMMAAKDPRDLFALTKRTQESIDGLLAYNRELFAIASGASAAQVDTAVEAVAQAIPQAPELALVKPAPVLAPELAAPVAAPELVAPVAAPQFVAPVAAAELLAPVAEPEVAAAAATAATATPAPPPEAKAKPIAKAVAKVAPKAVAAKPAAAPFPPAAAKKVVVTGIKPVEASRPPAPVSGKPAAAQQQLSLPVAKSKKKK